MSQDSTNRPQVMSLMLHLAGYVEAPYSYGSRAISDGTRVIPEGSVVDGKPTCLVNITVEVAPQDGSSRFFDHPAPSTPQSAPAESSAPAVPNSAESTGDKEFMQTPWIKPPRRESFNESDTRGWRRDYQKDYRSEHGNNS